MLDSGHERPGNIQGFMNLLKISCITRLSGIHPLNQPDYDDFRTKVPEKLQDSQKMKGLHGSTNPYIPKGLQMGWDVAAKYVLDRIGPRL